MNKKCLLLCTVLLLSISFKQIQAQPLPPNGGHGQTGDQIPGGGAPIGSGLVLSLSLGMGFLTYKYIYPQDESPQDQS